MTRIAAALLLASAIVAPPQDGTEIRGRVVDDRSVPVAGASVYLVGGPAPGARTAITTDEGRFAVRAVAAATYTIVVAKAGYPNTPGETIQVVPGPPKVLDVRLPRGAVIAGTVLDDAGEPIAGRQIILSRPSTPAAPIVRDKSVSSNARGQFRIFGLPAGSYGVAAALPGNSTYAVAAPAGSVVVTVAAGEEREVDVRAAPAGRTTYVTILPVSADGQPLRAPQVQLRRPGDARAAFSYGTRNADGSTTIADVPAGQYRASVESGSGRGAADIVVDGEHPVSATITVTPGVRIRGQVIFEGSISPPPRSSLRLTIADLDGLVIDDYSLQGEVAADGTFTIPRVPPGRFLIRASQGDADRWVLQSARAGEIDAADVPLTVGSADVTGVIVTMTDVKSRVRGRVTTSSGGAVSDIAVIAYPANPRARTYNSRRIATARTTAEGTYELAGLPPGDYSLAVAQDVDRDAIKNPAVWAKLPPVSSFTLGRGETRVQDVAIK